ncbi:MAG: TonB-dependent receptor domain-containing protein, partial [Gammaproteobacteria bacterium]
RNAFSFQTPGMNRRRFLTTRLDYMFSEKHQFNVVYNFQYYFANPDGVNSIFPLLPGTGTVLGHPDSGGTRRNSYGLVGALRSTLSPRMTSEVRFGVGPAGISLFREEIVPTLFEQWRGYAFSFDGYIQNPQRASSQSRRHTPVYTGNANITWSRGSHLLNLGGTWSLVKSWQQSLGSAVFPSVTLAMAANDPANTGTTSLFDTGNFPNSTAANRSDAAQLYALLTGRLSSITRSVALGEDGRYAHIGSVDRNRQREVALYAQDAWRVRPNLTLNYGLRWDVQFPFYNQSGTYTRVGYDGLWGISGVGNLFAPGVMTGREPQFFQAKPGQYAYNTQWTNFSPSLGFAWTLPKTDVPFVSWLLGRNGESVFRSGYSIATIREGMNIPINLWGSNQGRTVSTSVNPGNFPVEFGPAGSVWFRDRTLPARPEPDKPSYPIQVTAGNSVNDFDPNLRMGYVQSWN